MKYFKDDKGNINAYLVDGSQDEFIPSDLIAITEEEAYVILDSLKAPPTYKELRDAEYPPVAMYLDAVVTGDDVQLKEYIRLCQAVKEKYPKP